jgi:hypothetical protein
MKIIILVCDAVYTSIYVPTFQSNLFSPSTLMTDADVFAETSVYMHQTTRHHIITATVCDKFQTQNM